MNDLLERLREAQRRSEDIAEQSRRLQEYIDALREEWERNTRNP